MKKLLRQLFATGRTNSSRELTRFRPALECLEDRVVPATPAILDLTTAGAQGAVGAVLFQQSSTQPTGSGVIHSFVRLNAGGNTPVEQGYNTDARPLQFDENNSPVFTRSLQLTDIPVVTHNGVAYREFLLDINQKQSSPLLSLDELRFFVGNDGNLTGYDPTTNQLAGLNSVYDLDAQSDNAVLLNASLSHGSGSGDLLVDVPDALLTAPGGSFVYLYSKFGTTVSGNGGYEEWAVRGPSAASSSLSGFVFASQDGGTTFAPLAGVTITLTGVNNLGQTVTMTQTTDANGFYLFSGLSAGTYNIVQTQPQGYTFDFETAGTLGGTTSTNQGQFTTIVLGADTIGLNYDFYNVLGTGGGRGGA